MKAGDFLIIGLPGPVLDSEASALLAELKPAGIILFARNMPDLPSLLELTRRLGQDHPGTMLTIDHEGGRVDRTPEGFTRFPPPLVMAAKGEPGLMGKVGRAQGRELAAAGFDINFAPVVDVHTNPDNPVIGDRAFGTTPEMVIHNALPYLQGLAEAGIVGCVKHFPGHGDTGVDSHLSLPRLSHGRERLHGIELAPFARAIGQGAAMVMTAHVLCEALDDRAPVSLSRKAVDGCLRGELGFGGVVVSDDLEMGAITERMAVGEAAVGALAAGNDLAAVCQSTRAAAEAHGALARALEKGYIEPARLAEAGTNIEALKAKIRKLAQSRARAKVDDIGAETHSILAGQAGAGG